MASDGELGALRFRSDVSCQFGPQVMVARIGDQPHHSLLPLQAEDEGDALGGSVLCYQPVRFGVWAATCA